MAALPCRDRLVEPAMESVDDLAQLEQIGEPGDAADCGAVIQ
jgi:hypothetical protein